MKHKDNFGIWGVKVTMENDPKSLSVTVHLKVTKWKFYCWYLWMVLLGKGHKLI